MDHLLQFELRTKRFAQSLARCQRDEKLLFLFARQLVVDVRADLIVWHHGCRLSILLCLELQPCSDDLAKALACPPRSGLHVDHACTGDLCDLLVAVTRILSQNKSFSLRERQLRKCLLHHLPHVLFVAFARTDEWSTILIYLFDRSAPERFLVANRIQRQIPRDRKKQTRKLLDTRLLSA